MYQIGLKIEPLYLKHYSCYLTSITTRVVQQQQISIMTNTEYFYIAELIQLPVLTAHYGSHYTKPVCMGIF